MNNIHVETSASDDERRANLYRGDLFIYTPRSITRELCDLARTMAAEAFHPHDPRKAEHHLPVEEYAAILAELKPAFIHHPECKRLIPKLLAEFGCDLEQTYFDVPRLRTSTSDNYLTSGIAFAFHPHRDTWYSAPRCQINWWLPVYDMPRDSGMAFHPQHWSARSRTPRSFTIMRSGTKLAASTRPTISGVICASSRYRKRRSTSQRNSR